MEIRRDACAVREGVGRIVTVALVLAVLPAAAGCGSGGDNGGSAGAPTTGASSGGARVEIALSEWKLAPSTPRVDAAGAVTIHVTNSGSFGHALEVDGNGVEEETSTLEAGDSADLTVTLAPGTYEIYCPIGNHRQMGMEGTLTVAGGSGTGSVGTTTGDDAGDDSGGDGYGG